MGFGEVGLEVVEVGFVGGGEGGFVVEFLGEEVPGWWRWGGGEFDGLGEGGC